ncbi:AI-2E family transporter [Gorillibacterium massiliense]|uniref:AI-2E family transporter n=1 Tax=Gorillibacterium massiliense TaxID=1280390 RepID=UPI0004B4753E|nr:AI-2E family transporter [Gorillibacterium massiliense]
MENRFLLNSLKIIAVLLIILLLSKISFVFNPLISVFNILVMPFMIAGFFYYILRPIVRYLVKRKMNKSLAILLIYFVLTGVITVLAIGVWPKLLNQLQNLVNNLPTLVDQFRNQIEGLQDNKLLSYFGTNETELSTRLSGYLGNGITAVTNYLSRSLSVVTNFIFVMSTVPFILYYFLKEGDKLSTKIAHITPRKYRKDSLEVLGEIDTALSGYIVGRVIITSLLALMMYIGFLLIHLPYALLLAALSLFFNLIPYIGQFIGAVPCLIVGFIDSPTKALWVLIVILIAQQIEGNLLAPNIYGRRLDIHPLTTIVLILSAGDVLGVIGILAAIPIYMTAKVIVVRIYRLFLSEKVEEFVD